LICGDIERGFEKVITPLFFLGIIIFELSTCIKLLNVLNINLITQAMKNENPSTSNEFSKQMHSAESTAPDNSRVSFYRAIFLNDRIIVRRECEGVSNRAYNEVSLRNLKDNKVKGKLSKPSYLLVRKHLVAWSKAIQAHIHESKLLGVKPRHRLTMITLTLPSAQVHDDKYLKRELFGRYIEDLRRKHGIDYYFVRYESQANGNIHAHLVIDKFIAKNLITDWFIVHLKKLGYIDAFERKHGHCNPPCTHVTVLENTDESIDYLIGYVMKKTDRRAIEGRQYGMSDSLREFEPCSMLVCSEIAAELGKQELDDDVHKVHEDYFSVYIFKTAMCAKIRSKWLVHMLNFYYLQLYKRFYECGNV
jgi:hypothetical protein